MTRLSRRDALRAAGTGLAAGLAGCTGETGTVTVEWGFEDDDFETGGSAGPEVPPGEFEWRVERSRQEVYEGDWSLSVFTEGDHDDGTAWAVRPVEVEAGETYDARVGARAWSPSESFNTLRHLVMRLGNEKPEGEDDFPDPGMASTFVTGAPYGGLRQPLHLAAGWREYGFEWTVEDAPGTLYLAVGVSVVWEADATHYVDDVEASLEPQ